MQLGTKATLKVPKRPCTSVAVGWGFRRPGYSRDARYISALYTATTTNMGILNKGPFDLGKKPATRPASSLHVHTSTGSI